jgi:hypothetical protein
MATKKGYNQFFFTLLFCFLDRGSEIRYLGWTNHPGSATLIKTQGYAGATAIEHKTEKNSEFLGKYTYMYRYRYPTFRSSGSDTLEAGRYITTGGLC